MNDFEVFKTSVEAVTEDVVEITRELELGVEPEDGTELLQPPEKTLTMRSCFLRVSKESGFLRWVLLL